MSVITVLLDTLADRRQAIARLDADIEAKVPDLLAERSKLQAEAETLEKDIKHRSKFVADAHTLVGRLLQLVWVPRQPVWSEAKIIDLLDAYNNLACPQGYDPVKVADLQEQPEGYYRITKVGK